MFIDVYPYDDALVVTLGVGPSEVSRILVDMGSYANIIFKSTLNSMKIEDLMPGQKSTALYRFRSLALCL